MTTGSDDCALSPCKPVSGIKSGTGEGGLDGVPNFSECGQEVLGSAGNGPTMTTGGRAVKGKV